MTVFTQPCVHFCRRTVNLDPGGSSLKLSVATLVNQTATRSLAYHRNYRRWAHDSPQEVELSNHK